MLLILTNCLLKLLFYFHLQSFSKSCLCELVENATRQINLTALLGNTIIGNIEVAVIESNPVYKLLTSGNFSLCKYLREDLDINVQSVGGNLPQSVAMVQQAARLIADYTQVNRIINSSNL